MVVKFYGIINTITTYESRSCGKTYKKSHVFSTEYPINHRRVTKPAQIPNWTFSENRKSLRALRENSQNTNIKFQNSCRKPPNTNRPSTKLLPNTSTASAKHLNATKNNMKLLQRTINNIIRTLTEHLQYANQYPVENPQITCLTSPKHTEHPLNTYKTLINCYRTPQNNYRTSTLLDNQTISTEHLTPPGSLLNILRVPKWQYHPHNTYKPPT